MNDFSYKTQLFSGGELNEIAKLHERCIPAGFLPTLGVGFLARLYASIATSPEGVLIAAVDSKGNVVGFVSGSTSIRPIYKRLVGKNLAFLTALFIRHIFSVKTVKRILESRRYVARKHSEVQSIPAELFSIVVDEKFRGAGVAQRLFAELRLAFRDKGMDQFRITVGSQLTQAQRFYVKAGALKTNEVELHQGERSFVYECKI